MAERAFVTKSPAPDDGALAKALGKAAARWDEIARFTEDELGPIAWEWKHYSTGWTLKAPQKKGKRNLFFLIPEQGAFQLGFVFGDQAVAAIDADEAVPRGVVEELAAAKRYAEGRGLRLAVKTAKDVETAKALLRAKAKG
ncbi:MAG: DUF3788 family protein [Myxococcales bacterium]